MYQVTGWIPIGEKVEVREVDGLINISLLEWFKREARRFWDHGKNTQVRRAGGSNKDKVALFAEGKDPIENQEDTHTAFSHYEHRSVT